MSIYCSNTEARQVTETREFGVEYIKEFNMYCWTYNEWKGTLQVPSRREGETQSQTKVLAMNRSCSSYKERAFMLINLEDRFLCPLRVRKWVAGPERGKSLKLELHMKPGTPESLRSGLSESRPMALLVHGSLDLCKALKLKPRQLKMCVIQGLEVWLLD